MVEKVSFRQVGRVVSGKIYKGNVVDAYNRFTQPSIPAKAEQILQQSPLKSEGFGVSASRFSSSTPNKQPGPGSYTPLKSSSPSSSSKGMGTFVSNVSRFRKFQYNTPAPGPGAYNAVGLQRAQSGTLVYTKPSEKKPKAATPAPGQYELRATSSASKISSVFKSKVKRLEKHSNENPAPWQYSLDNKPMNTHLPNESFMFKLPGYKRQNQNLYDPHAPLPPDSGPGPGEYEIIQHKPITKTNMFKNQSKRFNENIRDRSPAPGQYNTDQKVMKAPVTGAVFMSETDRYLFLVEKKPPGPAFYKPVSPPKKTSFHFNAQRSWV